MAFVPSSVGGVVRFGDSNPSDVNAIRLKAEGFNKPGVLVFEDSELKRWYTWFDSTGRWRVSGSFPVDQENDGVVVGSQMG